MKKIIGFFAVFLFCALSSLFAQTMRMPNGSMSKSGTSKKDKTFPLTGKIRTYYIAADEVAWDYIPGDNDAMTGKPYTGIEKLYTQRSPTRIGKVYVKAIYREYTDATFKKLKQRGPKSEYLGILGPIIRAEVGDEIHVVFKNNASIPYSVHPHGVFYEKPSEGAVYNKDMVDQTHDGNAVAPDGRFTYVWKVPKRAGPGPNDPSSIVWLYHSHVVEPKDVNSGLVGAIIISAKGTTKPDGTPKGVDREIVSLFMVFDENSSWYLDRNVKTYCGPTADVKKLEAEFIPSDSLFALQRAVNASSFFQASFAAINLRFTINGYSFGAMPMMTMKKGEKVRWYLVTLGDAANFHTPHWHGNVVLYNKQRTDVIALMPAQMAVADMVPDNVGMWMFHCHVDDHMESGMMAMYEVTR